MAPRQGDAMRWGMVLAAGLGTRLRPLTDELPKPLVPVGDAPALAHVVASLRACCERIVVNAHHHADMIARAACPLGVEVLQEPTVLGTAGGVANARDRLGIGDVVVWNGDILTDLDVASLERARIASGAPAAWAIAPRARGEGTVGVDEGGFVVRVRDVRVGVEASGGDFLGISALSSEVVAMLPGEGCLVGDVLAPLVARGGRIVAIPHSGAWDDLGTPAAYLGANLRWLAERGLSTHLGAGADAGLATLDRVVLGPGARVEGGGTVARVVAWPGAVVQAPLSDAIVTRSRVVRVR